MCWNNDRLFYPSLKGADGNEILYEMDPADPIAIHFEFSDPEATKIQKANIMLQQKANLERDVFKLNRTVADELTMKTAELEKINKALHDTPNAIKVAAGGKPTIAGVDK
jgi:hypothetical protein